MALSERRQESELCAQVAFTEAEVEAPIDEIVAGRNEEVNEVPNEEVEASSAQSSPMLLPMPAPNAGGGGSTPRALHACAVGVVGAGVGPCAGQPTEI